MRVTQTISQTQFLTTINALENGINTTQNQISSSKSFTTASQNPTAAGSVNNYTQALAQSQQYGTNASSAQTNLNTEGNALTQVTNQLQTLRTLALEANTGTLTSSDRSAIATQAVQIQNSLLALANTTNGNGEYIFGGYASQSQPFSQSATGATYNGDQGQRQVQIAAGQTVADGDNGDTVFNNIKTGNGTFQVTAATGNTGSGLIGAASVTSPTAYVAGNYNVTFTDPTHYTVTDSAVPPNTVSTGTYTDGSTITFNGQQITLTGTPAAGDSFAVSTSTNQSIFATVQNLVNTLQSQASTAPGTVTAVNNQIGNAINNIDQALTNTSNVQASVGGRLNSITTQQSVAGSQQVQLQTSISQLQSLDFASALTTLTQQQTTLSAALQAFQLTQGLTLFKFL
ncbi:MAG: flagellar hook-associated protein 3 FlgL [Gammaproteobacteria bacterium]|jgi:flagellar hook-associated protein 3 FlgL|nr:flagellar hook-associated protein 3 FlgL [Gammaproteobacteria bacterium]